jgi:hypothetical protein
VQFFIGNVFALEASSPSQMMAVSFAAFGRWRSRQFAARFSVPSSYHLMETLPGAKEVFFTF